MQLGMIGLGRMGGNMVRRLMRAGHQCVVSDLSPQNVNALAGEGATGSTSLDDFVGQAHQAARRMDHGSGWRSYGANCERAGPALPGRRHHY